MCLSLCTAKKNAVSFFTRFSSVAVLNIINEMKCKNNRNKFMWKHHSTPKPFWVDSAKSRVYLSSVFCIRNQPRKGETMNRGQEEGISIASRRSVSIWKESYRSRVDRLIPICMNHIFNFNALKPSTKVLREWMFSFRYANCAVFFLHRAVSEVYNGRTRDPWAIFQ